MPIQRGISSAHGQWRPLEPRHGALGSGGRLFVFRTRHEQSQSYRAVFPAVAADARLPPDLDGLLRLLLRVVRLRSADA
ncbi:conserved hypothetical protein, partial [Ricinus communis]